MISIVIPYYNESACIGPLLERTRGVLKDAAVADYEILVVDNGSKLGEHLALKEKCVDSREKIIVLSRNFGYQGALWAGLDEAKGDPVIFMDGDGEDPPEVIKAFLAKWREGYDVVYGVRLSRQVRWYLNLCYKIFYRILARWAEVEIPLDAGEFSLVSGPALSALKGFRDRTRLLRILRAWVGFRQIGVPYDRPARIGGSSKFRFRAAIAFAWEGFVAGTDLPVRVSLYCTMFCTALCLLGILYYLAWYLLSPEPIPGFASLNITLLLMFSMVFFCVNVLARYTIKLLGEVRGRPPYLISTRVERV